MHVLTKCTTQEAKPAGILYFNKSKVEYVTTLFTVFRSIGMNEIHKIAKERKRAIKTAKWNMPTASNYSHT
jgi:hypothetical protein